MVEAAGKGDLNSLACLLDEGYDDTIDQQGILVLSNTYLIEAYYQFLLLFSSQYFGFSKHWLYCIRTSHSKESYQCRSLSYCQRSRRQYAI